jgi:CO/xanthine dehydrogenase FAD-binding subunit
VKPTTDGLILIAPGSTLRNAALLPGVPDALVQALTAAAPAVTIDEAISSGREQRLVAALLALDARLRLADPQGSTEVPIDERLTLDGCVLPRSGESLSGVVVRATAQPSTYCESSDDRIGLAVRIAVGDGPAPRILRSRVVWWGLAPAPFIAREVEGVLQGRSPDAALIDIAAQTARTEAQPAGAGMELDPRRLGVVTDLCRQALTVVFRDASGVFRAASGGT